jgi:ATP-dependent Clp protease ATP-binding subunit ClpA
VFERFAANARDAVRRATEEARLRGDRRVGTDHLLLGLLGDAGTAALLGASLDDGRRSAQTLDLRALAAIGFSSDELGAHGAVRTAGYLAFTAGAREVMRRMVALGTAERVKQLGMRHLVLAVLERQEPDPATAMLDDLGVDRVQVRERVLTA